MSAVKTIEYRIKDLVFWLLRPFLKPRTESNAIPVNLSRARRILFIRHDRIGDMVISLPVFQAVKRANPKMEIHILCSDVNVGVIDEDPRVDQRFLYIKRFFTDMGVVRQIRKHKYDAVVDLINSDSISGLILARLCARKAPLIGVQKRKYASYYDYAYFHEPSDNRHIIRNTLMTLDPLGLDGQAADPYAPLFISKKSRELAKSFLIRLNQKHPEATRLIGINLSAGQLTRRWGTQKFSRLIRLLTEQEESRSIILLFAMPPDRDRARRLTESGGDFVEIVPEGLNLNEATAIISKLDLLISPDTSLIHIARSFRVPVVGLYPSPPKNLIQWHPFEQREGAVVARSGDNVFDIVPEDVVACFRKFIGTPGVTRP